MSGATTATGVTMVVEERKSSAAAAGVEADGQNQNGNGKNEDEVDNMTSRQFS